MNLFLSEFNIVNIDAVPNGGTCLIDGDIVLHACGHVSDKEGYDLTEACKRISNMVNNIKSTLGLSEVKVFLSCSEYNFRNIAGISHIYKGNRKDTSKPSMYKDMKRYMLDLGAHVANGAEADDALGLAQTKNTVICTIDKDLDMIEGVHYNWKRREVYTVSRFEAQVFFYTQMLTGDSTDNIKGIYGIGKKKSFDLLRECVDEDELHAVVLDLYRNEFEDNYKVRFKENVSLLMISGAPIRSIH